MIFLTFFSFVFDTSLKAQRVKSSLAAPESIKSEYRTDAERLALRRVYNYGTNYMDSATIP